MGEIPSRSEQTRQQILTASNQLMLEHGYHATSMRQIAAHAGIALGGIYNHFASKEEIYEAIFFENHPFLEVLPSLLSSRGETPEALVRDAASRLLDILDRRHDFIKLMIIEIVEFNNSHTIQMVDRLLPQSEGLLSGMLRDYQDQLNPIPPAILVRSFVGLFISYYMTGMILQGSSKIPAGFVDQAFDHFVDIFLHGILKGESI
jgi:AcrR family transcriptional regulator